jgi:hypothetical protein
MPDYFGKLIGQRSPQTAAKPQQKTKVPKQKTTKESIPDATTPAKRTGRRDNPDYVQRSFYIRKDTAKQLKVCLAKEELELSTLVEDLLTDWLNKIDP